jgi:large subunit ribosomal protein L27
MRGGDDTIFATKTGKVKFQRWGKSRTKVSIVEVAAE